MIDISTLREPIEVYEAAIGNFGPLVKRLKSDAAIYEWEREALALLISGKLVPHKLGRGERRPDRLLSHEAVEEKYKLANADYLYSQLMEKRREDGTFYGSATKVIESVAANVGLDFERVNNYIRRSKGLKNKITPVAYGHIPRFQAWYAKREHDRARRMSR